jgi:hypothetical protein
LHPDRLLHRERYLDELMHQLQQTTCSRPHVQGTFAGPHFATRDNYAGSGRVTRLDAQAANVSSSLVTCHALLPRIAMAFQISEVLFVMIPSTPISSSLFASVTSLIV